MDQDWDQGKPGASAQRRYERLRARDEARLREKWGRFGGIAVALSEERQSTRAWSTGAAGEVRVGTVLDGLASDGIRVLHDRRIPGTRANIDHLVVTSDAVWVIDAKKYQGRPSLVVEGGLFRPRVEKLTVRGRDKTALVEGVVGQVERVSRAVPGVPVRGVLCFVDADWPLFGGSFIVRGVDVVWPGELANRIRLRTGGAIEVANVAARIADHFRPA